MNSTTEIEPVEEAYISTAPLALKRFIVLKINVPVNADIYDIDVLFVEENDEIVNPLGIKGLGDIGIVGVPAAITNAVFHATGKRIHELPITLDKVLPAMNGPEKNEIII